VTLRSWHSHGGIIQAQRCNVDVQQGLPLRPVVHSVQIVLSSLYNSGVCHNSRNELEHSFQSCKAKIALLGNFTFKSKNADSRIGPEFSHYSLHAALPCYRPRAGDIRVIPRNSPPGPCVPRTKIGGN
jgi:hypothetical protein